MSIMTLTMTITATVLTIAKSIINILVIISIMVFIYIMSLCWCNSYIFFYGFLVLGNYIYIAFFVLEGAGEVTWGG